MNRVIKFRIWDEQEKTMPFVGFHLFGEATIFHLIDQYAFETKGEKDTLLRYNDFKEMQFIGLLDKNGMEIYEGDIAQWIDVDENGKDFPIIAPMEWQQNNAQFRFNTSNYPPQYKKVRPEDVEVIGNIYENKNLLHDRTNI